MTFALIVVGGYLLGSCPWGYWLVRIFKGEDIRHSGSGNIGGSNVWRTYGRSLGLPVLIGLSAILVGLPGVLGYQVKTLRLAGGRDDAAEGRLQVAE